ncbi:hypothetical protein OIY81_1850 [Cryptosporidium canis]|nr:hypothetical protein OIY81_1850 [Cryptosporidium canis]
MRKFGPKLGATTEEADGESDDLESGVHPAGQRPGFRERVRSPGLLESGEHEVQLEHRHGSWAAHHKDNLRRGEQDHLRAKQKRTSISS